MKKTAFLFTILLIFICLLILPASALDEEKITLTVDGETEFYITTIDRQRKGINPLDGRAYDEISEAEVVTENGKTIASFLPDNTYLIWLNNADTEMDALNAVIETEDWNAELIQLFPVADRSTLVINPPDHYVSEEGFLFEKLTIIAQPDAFPAVKFNVDTDAGECMLSIDPTFALFTAKESALDSEAEMVFTLFPQYSELSLWISALDHFEDYPGSKFLLNSRVTCTDGEKTVSAVSVTDNVPVVSENGIISFNFGSLLSGSNDFFSGDLDGDDVYETDSAEEFFRFE